MLESRLHGAVRREETTLRLGGVGDNWYMTWAADDRQFVSLNNGTGWNDPPGPLYNTHLFTISGNPDNATFAEVPGFPELFFDLDRPETHNRYFGLGTLALDGRIYQFLSTPDQGSDWSGASEARFVGAKLIYSPDNGRTWCNQDGSTPVVWEAWDARSRENMVFFGESQDAFSLLTVLQMGRNYEANRDGYVYVYAPNGNTDGTMNELVMFRAPRNRILDRGAYEFFASHSPDGGAAWTKDIDARGIVHTFPRGWVNTTVHPYSWQPSVVYNQPLGLYMMSNWGTGCGPDGRWFTKPSYLGMWCAREPWGPWTQFYEESAWTPEGDSGARAYQPQISPKWIAEDGRSFWLVWTDFQSVSDDGPVTEAKTEEAIESMGTTMPYYGFNVQRVDLEV
jgi:hypothetical protein